MLFHFIQLPLYRKLRRLNDLIVLEFHRWIFEQVQAEIGASGDCQHELKSDRRSLSKSLSSVCQNIVLLSIQYRHQSNFQVNFF